MKLKDKLKQWLPASWVRRWRRACRRKSWQRNWSRTDYAPLWLGREISPEIVEAVADGWFPAGQPALDIGCGQGEVVAWLADRSFPSLGVDIAPAAIKRARSRYGEIPGRQEYLALDICARTPSDHQFAILIDRGCFHQIPDIDLPSYVQNILSVSVPDARLLLFVKAFRAGIPIGDPAEWKHQTARVRTAFAGAFTIIRSDQIHLDAWNGQRAEQALPGLVFWLERVPVRETTDRSRLMTEAQTAPLTRE